MTATTDFGILRTEGIEIASGDEPVGELRDSRAVLDDADELRARMDQDGYLFVRGFHPRGEVMEARAEVVRRLAELGFLKPGTDPMDALGYTPAEAAALHAERVEGQRESVEQVDEAERILNLSADFMPDQLAADNAPLDEVIYGSRMMTFFQEFLGEPAKHYDFTWFRSVQPGGNGASPHTDVIFMGRAEREQLYTVWTPMGDIDVRQGGLIVLEGSHKNEMLRHGYSTRDADSYCANKADQRDYFQKLKDNDSSTDDGRIASDARQVQQAVGGRWLTTNYEAGDILVFSVFTVHGSLDNTTDQIRLSSDSRYQPASKEADERWIGERPPGARLRRALIC